MSRGPYFGFTEGYHQEYPQLVTNCESFETTGHSFDDLYRTRIESTAGDDAQSFIPVPVTAPPMSPSWNEALQKEALISPESFYFPEISPNNADDLSGEGAAPQTSLPLPAGPKKSTASTNLHISPNDAHDHLKERAVSQSPGPLAAGFTESSMNPERYNIEVLRSSIPINHSNLKGKLHVGKQPTNNNSSQKTGPIANRKACAVRKSRLRHDKKKLSRERSSIYSSRLNSSEPPIPGPLSLSGAAASACNHWLNSHQGSFTGPNAIYGLHLAYEAPERAIRQWFEHYVVAKDNFGTVQRVVETGKDITLAYRQRRKCPEKRNAGPNGGLVYLKDQEWPYVCTSGCGARFKKKDGWKRHEEKIYPQGLWHCRLGSCMSKPEETISLRKDKFRDHLRTHHDLKLSNEELEHYYLPIDSGFDRQCIFRNCEKILKSWKQRIDHVALELKKPWDPSDWRDLNLDSSTANTDGTALSDAESKTDHDTSSSDEYSNDSDDSNDAPREDSNRSSGSGPSSSPGSGTGQDYFFPKQFDQGPGTGSQNNHSTGNAYAQKDAGQLQGKRQRHLVSDLDVLHMESDLDIHLQKLCFTTELAICPRRFPKETSNPTTPNSATSSYNFEAQCKRTAVNEELHKPEDNSPLVDRRYYGKVGKTTYRGSKACTPNRGTIMASELANSPTLDASYPSQRRKAESSRPHSEESETERNSTTPTKLVDSGYNSFRGSSHSQRYAFLQAPASNTEEG